MPAFNFICKKCNNEFELFLKFTEKPKCPNCNSIRVEKMFSNPNCIVSNEKSSSYKQGEAKENALESLKDKGSSVVMKRNIYKDRKTGKDLGMGPPEIVKTNLKGKK